MNAEFKLQSYVTTLTVIVMYFFIIEVLPLMSGIDTGSKILKPLITVVSTIGLYRIISSILLSIVRNWNLAKKHLLGPKYLNGTWVGKFHNSNNQNILTIETFEQTLSTLSINGYAFTQDGNPYASWRTIAVSVDDRSLTYTYACDPAGGATSFQGIGAFNLEREAAHKPPIEIIGYSADITDGTRTGNTEVKISDKMLAISDALVIAQKKLLDK